MDKKTIIAWAILMVSMQTLADATPMGTAASKAAIYSPSSWKIEKIRDGSYILDTASREEKWHYRDERRPIFRITNATSIASRYYIKAMDAVNVNDGSLAISIIPKVRNGVMAYRVGDHVWGFLELAANSSQFIAISTVGEFGIKPGRYTAYLQLIVPSP